jgi:hypothetical protein
MEPVPESRRRQIGGAVSFDELTPQLDQRKASISSSVS